MDPSQIDPSARQEAEKLWRQALDLQMTNDLSGADTLYRASIRVHPTAEAWTFLGWNLSFRGLLEEAIEACHRAIDCDPEFGNPYNDIGAYLVEMGRLDEAVPWFEKARHAKRYETPHFPHLNLARVFIRQGALEKAAVELQTARVMDPEDSTVDELMDTISMLASQGEARPGASRRPWRPWAPKGGVPDNN